MIRIKKIRELLLKEGFAKIINNDQYEQGHWIVLIKSNRIIVERKSLNPKTKYKEIFKYNELSKFFNTIKDREKIYKDLLRRSIIENNIKHKVQMYGGLDNER